MESAVEIKTPTSSLPLSPLVTKYKRKAKFPRLNGHSKRNWQKKKTRFQEQQLSKGRGSFREKRKGGGYNGFAGHEFQEVQAEEFGSVEGGSQRENLDQTRVYALLYVSR